ncbi:MAG: hypothetical protein ACJASM_003129, partial [Salibacteraceae bacterium]
MEQEELSTREQIENISNLKFETFENAIEVAFEKLSDRMDQFGINLNLNELKRKAKRIKSESKKKDAEIPPLVTEAINMLAEYNEYFVDYNSIMSELRALQEMKVLFLFKNIETSIKRIIKIGYGDSTSKLFRWESMQEFMKNKGIKPKLLNGFEQMNQLRIVGNCIKHSDQIDSHVQVIEEFNDSETFTFQNLAIFYSRVNEGAHLF